MKIYSHILCRAQAVQIEVNVRINSHLPTTKIIGGVPALTPLV